MESKINRDNNSFSISDLAREFGITTRTLRFYEEKGLLSPVRNGNGRVFSAADRVRLILILRGKRLGFSLEESRDIIAMYEPKSGNDKQLQTLLETIKEKRGLLEEKRKEINAMLRDLNKTEKTCREAMSASGKRKL